MLKVMLHKLGEHTDNDICIMEELDERFYLHVGRTKDYRFLTLNANSKTSSEVRISSPDSFVQRSTALACHMIGL